MGKILSGITATGKLTIGNYIGAIKSFIELQEKHELFIFVADLHALTIDIAPETLRENKRSIMALYLAAGLDPKRTTLFFQSDVAAHGQLAWILENQTTLGELFRMTQFKEKGNVKTANGTQSIRTGLLTYPALMAADILLYQPTMVPVGADQKQHIELARNIAQRFNNKYGVVFNVPEFFAPPQGAKILSLTDPAKKMSKSDANPKSAIYLLDDPEIAAQKIRKAVTDSEGKIYLSDNKAGVTNLLTIYASLRNETLSAAATLFANKNYGELKEAVAKEVTSFLKTLQSKYQANLSNVESVARQGAQKAALVANATLLEVEVKIGLR